MSEISSFIEGMPKAELAHEVLYAVGSPFGSPQYRQDRTPVRG